ncbi:MAG: GNAT family N-acetyltransferase [Minisyncoccia bacterium]
MTIRKLTTANRDAVKDINRLLQQLSQDSSRKGGTLGELKRIVADPTAVLLTLKDGTRIIGVATLYLMTQMGKSSGYVEDVVVDEAYRGQGLGAKLMNALIAEARKKKLGSIHLTSRPARVAANKLYQKLGFEQRETNVYRLKL